jgi:carbonic anhydrase
MIEIVYRYDPNAQDPPRQPGTPAEARSLLEEGNRTFAELLSSVNAGEPVRRVIPFDPRDIGWGEGPGIGPTQKPFAAVLSCSDARVPTEMVLRQGSNSLFVARVAGNVVGNESLGSLLYAIQHFANSLKLVVVLAHSRCGAVTAAVDAYLKPRRYLPLAAHNPLKSIVDSILVAVRSAALALEEVHGTQVAKVPGYPDALLAASIVLNAAWAAFSLQHTVTPDLRSNIDVMFSVYDLDSRYLRLPLAASAPFAAQEMGLFPAPKESEEFRNLARTVCGGGYVQKLLGQSPELQ